MTASPLRARIVRQFARPSGALGWLAGWIMAHRASNRRRNLWTVDLLRIRSGERILEIGFGPGLAIEAVLAHGAEAVGLDHSPVMLRMAARRNAAAVAAGRARLSLGGPEVLSPALGTFDKALAVNVHMFWSDPVAKLAAVGRVLKQDGELALTFQPRNAGASRQDTERGAERMVADLHAAGFAEARTEWLPLNPPAVCVLARTPVR